MLGVRVRPFDSLLLRSSWSTAFRAPSLAQVGAGTTLGAGSLECSAEFLDNFCNGESGADGYLSEIYGNPDLEPEKAETFNIGFAWSPNRDFTLTTDYWQITHEDLVGIDEERQFRRALNGEIPVVARDELEAGSLGIETRDGTIGSPVEALHLQLENLGEQRTRGVDVGVTYYKNFAAAGSFTFALDATHLVEFTRQGSQASVSEQVAGEFRFPKWVLTPRIRWRNSGFNTNLTVIHTSSYRDNTERFDDALLEQFGISRDRKVPSWTKVNLSTSYDFSRSHLVRLGIANLFDEDPPRVYGTSANVDHANHDSLGRTWRASYTYTF